jgi:hypothetical protein
LNFGEGKKRELLIRRREEGVDVHFLWVSWLTCFRWCCLALDSSRRMERANYSLCLSLAYFLVPRLLCFGDPHSNTRYGDDYDSIRFDTCTMRYVDSVKSAVYIQVVVCCTNIKFKFKLFREYPTQNLETFPVFAPTTTPRAQKDTRKIYPGRR